SNLISMALGELMVGGSIALALQLVFAAILWAGQVLDIQAGFGLAMVADPTTHAQMPLAGTVFAYAGAAVFFATGAQFDLLAIWAQGLQTMPLGYGVARPDMAALGVFMGSLFAIAMGLVAIVMLVLFLLDIAIAFMSRTLPQMNVLLFGFQVKSMAMLVTLPIAMSLSASLFFRLIRMGLSEAPTLLAVN
ncbi:MAG: flagellar biosynthetic protein FliR, partial [Sphingorhabdus sp.]|uniref:flagellar biosynthetic protein FliR n=1 Tax=Sphingorhabdus sp. TaxID=1902408 RepID=UPI003C858A8D